jgi:hypothetical protein
MLRKTKAAAASSPTADVSRFHDRAEELVRRNNELLEENRQMRAAFALWAKVATGICVNCIYNPNAVDFSSGQGRDGPKDLIQLGNSLQQSLDSLVSTSSPPEAPAHPDYRH